MGVVQQILSSYKTVTGYGTRAQSFFTATGITDTTIKNVIDAAFNSLHTAGLIDKNDLTYAGDKIKAFYPFVGGTAGTNKYNMLRPTDTDADYRLTFTGGWTHDANGSAGNGTNAYADTHFLPTSLGLDSATLFCWNRSNVNNVYVDMGSTSNSSGGDDFQLVSRLGGTNYSMLNAPNVAGFASSDSSQFQAITRTSSTTLAHFRNTTKTTITKTSATRNSYSVYISARNAAGTAEYFDTKQKEIAGIADGLNDTEMNALYNVCLDIHNGLGR